jgi:hypothetical protein
MKKNIVLAKIAAPAPETPRRGIRIRIPTRAFDQITEVAKRNGMTKTDLFLEGIAAEMANLGEYTAAARFRSSVPPPAEPEVAGKPPLRKTKSGSFAIENFERAGSRRVEESIRKKARG